jgi:hypothetical protein
MKTRKAPPFSRRSSMTSKELAIAIDTKMLARKGSDEFNPCFCAVPAGITRQAVT